MNLHDLSFNHVHIQPPKPVDEDHYRFAIHYTNDYTNPIVFRSMNPYKINIVKDSCELHIKHKSDLLFFNGLYKHLTNALYELHEEWFENKFERDKYDAMFKHYLYPNIEENAVNIKCTICKDILQEIQSGCLICPTFELAAISFDQVSFHIELKLIHMENKDPIKETPPPAPKPATPPLSPAPDTPLPVSEPEHEPAPVPVIEPPLEQKCELEMERTTLSNQFDEYMENQAQIKEPEVIIENDIEDNIEEIKLNHSGDLEEATLQLNDEDYFILFKVIQSNIKENFSQALLKTFEEKKIETKNINIQDIVYDSEDSDDEYLQNDEFEKDYNNMVN